MAKAKSKLTSAQSKFSQADLDYLTKQIKHQLVNEVSEGMANAPILEPSDIAELSAELKAIIKREVPKALEYYFQDDPQEVIDMLWDNFADELKKAKIKLTVP
jgi:hypothetical protein